MNAVPMTFPQKWEATFSEDAEKNHAAQRDLCDISWLAICVTLVATVILSSVLFQQTGIFVVSIIIPLIWDRIIKNPAQEFYDEAQDQQRLLKRSRKITSLYKIKQTEEANCPAGAALCDYWKAEVQSSYKAFIQAKKNASNKDFLEKQKDAATKKVEYLFWKTLAKNNEKFEKVFLKYGIDAHSAISEFAIWDSRSTEDRSKGFSNQLSSKDVLLKFKNRFKGFSNQLSSRNVLLKFKRRISSELVYSFILSPNSEILITRCFAQALKDLQPTNEEARPPQSKTFIQIAANSIVAYY